MSLSLNEFIADQENKLKAFEDHWRKNHQANPDMFPMTMKDGNEGAWDEQLDCFNPDANIKSLMNIPDDIYQLAKEHGLKALSTGGDIDYMSITNKLGTFIIRDIEDAGSPDSLNEECYVCLFTDEEWTQGYAVKFNHVLGAIDALTSAQFQYDVAKMNTNKWNVFKWT